MNAEKSQNALLTHYLLGELSEAEQSKLEERYFTDPELFDELRSVRDDLVDAYVRDELSPDLRQRFERFFNASPRRREQIQFAEALLQAVDSRRPVPVRRAMQPSTWERLLGFVASYKQPIFAAAALVLLVGGAWFVVHYLRERQRAQSRQAQVITSNRPLVEASTPTPTTSPQPPGPSPSESPTGTSSPESKSVFATFVLTSDLVRGSTETQKLVIPKDATIVQLRLTLEGTTHKSFSAAVRTPEGVEVWTAKQLKPQATSVVPVSLPANVLKNADYIIRLTGHTAENEMVNVANYYFRVEKR